MPFRLCVDVCVFSIANAFLCILVQLTCMDPIMNTEKKELSILVALAFYEHCKNSYRVKTIHLASISSEHLL